MKQIIIVTGPVRSGTSAMMGALSKGGVPILADPYFDVYIRSRFPNANPAGWFETKDPLGDCIKWLSHNAGNLVALKLPGIDVSKLQQIANLPGIELSVIVMQRPKLEREASELKHFNTRQHSNFKEDFWQRQADRYANHTTTINYHRLVISSVETLQQIQDFIPRYDASLGASFINPELWREKSNLQQNPVLLAVK